MTGAALLYRSSCVGKKHHSVFNFEIKQIIPSKGITTAVKQKETKKETTLTRINTVTNVHSTRISKTWDNIQLKL